MQVSAAIFNFALPALCNILDYFLYSEAYQSLTCMLVSSNLLWKIWDKSYPASVNILSNMNLIILFHVKIHILRLENELIVQYLSILLSFIAFFNFGMFFIYAGFMVFTAISRFLERKEGSTELDVRGIICDSCKFDLSRSNIRLQSTSIWVYWWAEMGLLVLIKVPNSTNKKEHIVPVQVFIKIWLL